MIRKSKKHSRTFGRRTGIYNWCLCDCLVLRHVNPTTDLENKHAQGRWPHRQLGCRNETLSSMNNTNPLESGLTIPLKQVDDHTLIYMCWLFLCYVSDRFTNLMIQWNHCHNRANVVAGNTLQRSGTVYFFKPQKQIQGISNSND